MPSQAPFPSHAANTTAPPGVFDPQLATMPGSHVPGGYSGPPQFAPHSGFDTNYIEDYLKLIESMSGDISQMTPAGYRVPNLNAATHSAAQFPPVSGQPLPTAFPAKSAIDRWEGRQDPSANTLVSEDVRKTIMSVLGQQDEGNGAVATGTVQNHSAADDLVNRMTAQNLAAPATLPSIDQIVRNIKPEVTEAPETARSKVTQPESKDDDDDDDDDVGLSDKSDGTDEENNDSDKVNDRLVVAEDDSNTEDLDLNEYYKKAADVKKSDTEQAMNGEDVEIKQEKEEDSDDLGSSCTTNSGRRRYIRKKRKSKIKLKPVPVKEEGELVPERVPEKVGGRQKRKKKIPVKLPRQRLVDSDDSSDDEEAMFEPTNGDLEAGLGTEAMPEKKRRGRRKGKRKLSCDKCTRIFNKPEALVKHNMLHEKEMLFSCHVCGMKYARTGELTRHLRKHAGETYNCLECSQEFVDSRDFKKHMSDSHEDQKPFTCIYAGCNFRSDKPSNLEKHAAIHSGIRMYTCPHCSKDFTQSNGLRSHLRSCLQERKYLCDICGQKFNHLQSLKSHRMLHTGEKPHMCKDCGARFTDHRNFKRHRRIHENLFPYPCSYCEKRFRHSNSLKAHVRTHTMEPPPPRGEPRKRVVPAPLGGPHPPDTQKTEPLTEQEESMTPDLVSPPASMPDILPNAASLLGHDSMRQLANDFRSPVSSRDSIHAETLSMASMSGMRLPPHSSLMSGMTQAMAARMEMHLTPNDVYMTHQRDDMRMASPHPSVMTNLHAQDDMRLTSPRPPSHLPDDLHAHPQDDLRMMSPPPRSSQIRDDYHHVPTPHDDMRMPSHPSHMRDDLRLMTSHHIPLESLPYSHYGRPREDLHLPPAHSFSFMYRDTSAIGPAHDSLHLSTRDSHAGMGYLPRDDLRMLPRDYKYS